jgi:hypothetical protein
MKTLLYLLILGFASFYMACVAGGNSDPTSDSGIAADTGTDSQADLFSPSDAAGLSDAGLQADTGEDDAATLPDTGEDDAATLPDTGMNIADVSSPADAGGSDSGMADATPPLPKGLSGVAPPGDTALPQFSAVVDQDGNSVGPDRLVGTWSVLWFYPIASTAG